VIAPILTQPPGAEGSSPDGDAIVIARVDAIPVALPLKKPMLMGSGQRITHAYNLLVRIESRGGAVGWGEASSAPMMTGDLLPGMVSAVEHHLGPVIKGRNARERALLSRRCQASLVGNTGAKCAVDIALQDLVGRHLGVGVVDLFGGALRQDIRPMYLLGNASIEEDLAEVEAKLAEGWTFFKLKVGIKDPLEEADAAVRIRRLVGSAVTLCADANMGMTLASSRQYIRNAAAAGLLFLEQPLGGQDHAGMAALARSSPLPLNGDESVGTIGDIVTLQAAGAVQGVNLKTIKLGGITPVVQAMAICEALGLEVNLACKVAESSISAAAALHLACLAPNLSWGVNITNHYLAEDIVEVPVEIVRGGARRPEGPGLGVQVHEPAVARFRIG
jgi:muconate cycloisomerase